MNNKVCHCTLWRVPFGAESKTNAAVYQLTRGGIQNIFNREKVVHFITHNPEEWNILQRTVIFGTLRFSPEFSGTRSIVTRVITNLIGAAVQRGDHYWISPRAQARYISGYWILLRDFSSGLSCHTDARESSIPQNSDDNVL